MSARRAAPDEPPFKVGERVIHTELLHTVGFDIPPINVPAGTQAEVVEVMTAPDKATHWLLILQAHPPTCMRPVTYLIAPDVVDKIRKMEPGERSILPQPIYDEHMPGPLRADGAYQVALEDVTVLHYTLKWFPWDIHVYLHPSARCRPEDLEGNYDFHPDTGCPFFSLRHVDEAIDEIVFCELILIMDGEDGYPDWDVEIALDYYQDIVEEQEDLDPHRVHVHPWYPLSSFVDPELQSVAIDLHHPLGTAMLRTDERVDRSFHSIQKGKRRLH